MRRSTAGHIKSLMELISKEEQLKLFAEVAYQMSHESVELRRFELLTHAFQNIGLGSGFRWRIGRRVEEGKAIAVQYGFGNYGSLDITNLRYRVDTQDEERLHEQDEAIFLDGHSTTPSDVNSSFRPKSSAISFIQMWLYRYGKNIGIATFDYPGASFFSAYVREALDPYKHLMVLALNADPHELQDDVVSFVSRLKQRQVVILGKDTGPESERLRWIAEILLELGYEPVIVKDEPDIPEISNEEKVLVFMNTSRFAVVENSFASGEIAELKMSSANRIISACVRETGRGSTWMLSGYPVDFNFIQEFEYDGSHESLRRSLQQATKWAEDRIVERRKYYQANYPRQANESGSSGD